MSDYNSNSIYISNFFTSIAVTKLLYEVLAKPPPELTSCHKGEKNVIN